MTIELIKITELPDIGGNLNTQAVMPVVNLVGGTVTNKVTVGNLANLMLSNAGVNYPPAFQANVAYFVTNNNQPNITSVGTLTALTVSGNVSFGPLLGLTVLGAANFTQASVQLGSVSNITITGGSAGQILSTDGTGNLAWVNDANSSYGNSNVASYLPTYTGNLSAGNADLGNAVIANYFVGNGSLLTGVTSYSNANAVAYGESGWSGNIIPSSNAVYSLGNSSNQWMELWVSNSTIYIGGVPLGITAGNVLTVGGQPLLSNDSNTSIATTGNITADIVTANSVIANNIGNIAAINLDGNISNVLTGTGAWVTAPSGATGPQGAIGATGANGADGATGATGPAGTIGVDGSTGATGPTGSSGATGATGATGPAGSNGADGATGATGPAGSAGTNGATGATGAFSGTLTQNLNGNGYNITNVATFSANTLQGISANVTLTAGSYSYTFDNAGNVTFANGIANFPGTANTGISAIKAGVTNTLLPNTVTSFSANVNSYTQVTLQNKSTGADATADYILTADNGSDTVNYVDLGVINSGYDPNTPTNSLGNIVYAADGYLYAQGNSSNASQSGGNLVIGTTVANKTVKIFAGGANSNSIVATFSNTGISGNTNGYTIGYLNIPQVVASNTTLAASDAGKHYYSTTAGNLTLTIPLNSSVAFSTGTAISIVVQAAGNVLINAASGVTLYMAGNSSSGNRVVGTYGMATLMKVATDTWFINGTGVS